MKRLSCVVFIVVALLTSAPSIFASPLAQGEQEIEKTTQSTAPSVTSSPSQWSFDDSDDDDEEDDEPEEELKFWARMAKRYEATKMMMKIGYNAKVRPLLRDLGEHKKAIYGTTASVAAAIALLYGIKKMKSKSAANRTENAQAGTESSSVHPSPAQR
ncbi:MAG: hypothetical protein QG632_17 [Candidatus Dependentiae bacterium]|nr:hypothetical protein [Candidatus Dependentiae bacterium]